MLFRSMNRVFRPYLDQFIIVFIDDILIYSKRSTKSMFELHYRLSEIIDCMLSLANADAVSNWIRPTNASEVRNFLSLAGYNRRFVEGFSKIASPLTALTRKDSKFVWTDKHERVFMELKERLTSAPILAIPKSGE